jgi:hypothetical protein
VDDIGAEVGAEEIETPEISREGGLRRYEGLETGGDGCIAGVKVGKDGLNRG